MLEESVEFVKDQIENAPFRINAYIKNESGELNPKRNAFIKLQKYIDDFHKKISDVRWIIMPGLRGTGKTTILAQLFNYVLSSKKSKYPVLFISIDQATRIINSNTDNILKAYEIIIKTRFEKLNTPIYLFLDEVQYDEKWAITLKSLFDKTKNVFIITTGSSALSLNTNSDVARRTITEKIFPMSLTEFFKIKYNKHEVPGLGKTLCEIIFNSKSAGEVYEGLSELKTQIIKYYENCCGNRIITEIERYLEVGTLPFLLKIENKSLVYEQINKTLEKVISYDLPQLGKFKQENIAKVSEILYLLASADTISTVKLSESVGMSRPVLVDLLRTIEQTDLITRIFPHGSHTVQVKKPSRYHFTSPAFRAMFFNYISSIIPKDIYKGYLLEDAIALYLSRLFYGKLGYSLTYDSGQGGADFIVGIAKEIFIPIEVGIGNKPFRQIISTMSKVKSKYGLCLSLRKLEINNEHNVVSIPFTYFLLL
jgi:hypothetical protein